MRECLRTKTAAHEERLAVGIDCNKLASADAELPTLPDDPQRYADDMTSGTKWSSQPGGTPAGGTAWASRATGRWLAETVECWCLVSCF